MADREVSKEKMKAGLWELMCYVCFLRFACQWKTEEAKSSLLVAMVPELLVFCC
jgi:hypothetical protein